MDNQLRAVIVFSYQTRKQLKFLWLFDAIVNTWSYKWNSWL